MSAEIQFVDSEGHWVKQPSHTGPVCTEMMMNPRRYWGCTDDCPECAKQSE